MGLAGDDVLHGGAGDDLVEGGAGNDTLDGGTNLGDVPGDTVSYDDATSGVTVSLAITTAQNVGGGDGIDTLSNFQSIRGSDFNDVLTGDGNDNSFQGGAGDDILNGGSGGFDWAVYADATSGVTVNLSLSGPQSVGGRLGADTLINIEGLFGSSYNDVLIGNASDNELDGGPGNT